MAKVIAKFKVGMISEREIDQWLADEGRSGKRLVKDVTLYPVSYEGSPENKAFYASTPSGAITLSTVNMAAADAFTVGKDYYVTFEEAK